METKDVKPKMTFEEWLKTVWQEDENRAIRKRQIDELREEIKPLVIDIINGIDGCTCDSCVASCIETRKEDPNKPPSWIVNSLIVVALEYLLGRNFNGASARYYHGFVKQNEKIQ